MSSRLRERAPKYHYLVVCAFQLMESGGRGGVRKVVTVYADLMICVYDLL
jgi:hypothetical protein